MSGFYSLPSPRVWRGERLHRSVEGSSPDPYGSDQPGYRERNRQTATEIGNGSIRIDIGAPIVRVRGAPQPVSLDPPAETFEAPEGAPEVAAAPEETARDLASLLRATTLPEYKPGLGRG